MFNSPNAIEKIRLDIRKGLIDIGIKNRHKKYHLGTIRSVNHLKDYLCGRLLKLSYSYIERNSPTAVFFDLGVLEKIAKEDKTTVVKQVGTDNEFEYYSLTVPTYFVTVIVAIKRGKHCSIYLKDVVSL